MTEYPKGNYVTEITTNEKTIRHAITCGEYFHVVFDNGEFIELNHSEEEIDDIFGLNNPGLTVKNEFKYICRYVEPEIQIDKLTLHDTDLTVEEIAEQLDDNNE